MLARGCALVGERAAHFVGGVREGKGDVVKLVSIA
jgi:hypothetical protein